MVKDKIKDYSINSKSRPWLFSKEAITLGSTHWCAFNWDSIAKEEGQLLQGYLAVHLVFLCCSMLPGT